MWLLDAIAACANLGHMRISLLASLTGRRRLPFPATLALLAAVVFRPWAPDAVAQSSAPIMPDLVIFRVQRLRQIPAHERDEAFEEYVRAVRAALDAGENEPALQMATRASELWKQLRRPWLHRSAAELALRKWSPSIAAAREARKARDDSMRPQPRPDETEAAASYWEGRGLYETQRYDEALPRLVEATERAPEWPEAWRAYAEALFVSGDDAAAGPVYAKALALDPQLGNARDLSYYAEATAARGDLESAIAAMQEAISRYPYQLGLHANLGRMFQEEGDLAEAYYYFTLELLLHGTDSRFASNALEATSDILVLLNDEPNHPSRHELLQVSQGLQHLRDGSAHRAAHFFEHAVRVSRSSTPVPRILLAEALLRGGDVEESRIQLEDVLVRWPDFVPALVVLAEAQRQLGERDLSHRTRERAASLFPSYWKLHERDG